MSAMEVLNPAPGEAHCGRPYESGSRLAKLLVPTQKAANSLAETHAYTMSTDGTYELS